MISQLEVLCKRVGKRDESPYVECLRYCIRRKRSQRAATLWGSRLKGNPKGKLLDKGKREEERAGRTASDSKPTPALVPAATLHVNALTPFTSCFTYLGELNRSFCVNPGAQRPGLMSPSKAQQGPQFEQEPPLQQGNFPCANVLLEAEGLPWT